MALGLFSNPGSNASGVPVVPQGGLTGLAGGAKPVKDCVLISMEKMNAIESIDLPSSTVSVQSGVTMGAVQRHAKDHGLFFPLDLGGRDSCTIGGNLSTNAGGNRVLRYGMARDLVLGLEVVLADGTILSRKLLSSSGNKAWDDAVLRAIDKTEVLPRDTDGRVPPVIVLGFRPLD